MSQISAVPPFCAVFGLRKKISGCVPGRNAGRGRSRHGCDREAVDLSGERLDVARSPFEEPLATVMQRLGRLLARDANGTRLAQTALDNRNLAGGDIGGHLDFAAKRRIVSRALVV